MTALDHARISARTSVVCIVAGPFDREHTKRVLRYAYSIWAVIYKFTCGWPGGGLKMLFIAG